MEKIGAFHSGSSKWECTLSVCSLNMSCGTWHLWYIHTMFIRISYMGMKKCQNDIHGIAEYHCINFMVCQKTVLISHLGRYLESPSLLIVWKSNNVGRELLWFSVLFFVLYFLCFCAYKHIVIISLWIEL